MQASFEFSFHEPYNPEAFPRRINHPEPRPPRGLEAVSLGPVTSYPSRILPCPQERNGPPRGQTCDRPEMGKSIRLIFSGNVFPNKISIIRPQEVVFPFFEVELATLEFE